MSRYPKISIIIPLHVVTDRFFNDLSRFKELNYPNYEILIVSDKSVKLPRWKNFRLITTRKKKTGPAIKRDIAIAEAKGEICAFIDDDAYPDLNWLRNAVREFKDAKIVGVGGPGLTPPEDNYWSQLTGLVYSSFYCGGFAMYRFIKGKRRFVVDYPAYNLLVKTEVLKKIGGYGNDFYGGEDTFLCLKLVKSGYKLIYSPTVVVYHHRRQLFIPYLKQIANVGQHRGYFAKRFPETSRTLGYFIPSILAIGFIAGLIASIIWIPMRLIFFTILIVAFSLGVISVIRRTNLLNAAIVSVGILSTHLVYGLNFIKGLLIKNLDR